LIAERLAAGSKRAVSQMLAAAHDGEIKAVEQFLARFPADACIQVGASYCLWVRLIFVFQRCRP